MGQTRRPQPRRLASKLKAIRTKLNLSQEQMAERLTTRRAPVYPGHVSEFERRKREPSLIVLLQYARSGGVSVEALIDDALDVLS